MAKVQEWIEGARLRTLSAGISPVLAGTGIAVWASGTVMWLEAVLAGIVGLSLQIGSNFSNDYSDGIRGTDDVRTGPARLTGGGKAQPQHVKLAAFASYGIGGMAGLVLVWLCGQWWLLILGLAAILAAWFYTGGRHPYGYMGLGEVFVFLFFGLMAGAGTTYTQIGSVPWQAWWMSASVGFIACAVLMINNVRDIPTDKTAGKITLAVRLGDRYARFAYDALCVLPVVGALAFVGTIGWLVIFYIPALVIATMNVARVEGLGRKNKAQGRELIPILRNTGFVELAYALATLGVFLVA